MKSPSIRFLLLLSSALFSLPAAADDDYTFFIRQVQMPDALIWDVAVDQQGSQLSPLAINPNGARFELWTVKSSPLTSYLLDTTYVNSYIPVADVTFTSEDPYEVIPRTRADRPFTVTIDVQGLSPDPDAPEAAKGVKLLRHVQSYGADGNGIDINRSYATLLSQGSLESNGTFTLDYPVTSIPGADRTQVRGEERISVFSYEDYQAPESQLASQFIQIWPLADSTVTGIEDGDLIKGNAPRLTIDLNDLYPDSYTYAQVYRGNPQLGAEGTRVPGSALLVDSSVPRDEQLVVEDWDRVIDEDGDWVLEVLTDTPFGTDRLEYLTFTVKRTIRLNGSVTSVD